MHVGRQSIDPHDYELSGIKIQKTNEEKDIGVIVDDKLSFEKHICVKIKRPILWQLLLGEYFSI